MVLVVALRLTLAMMSEWGPCGDSEWSRRVPWSSPSLAQPHSDDCAVIAHLALLTLSPFWRDGWTSPSTVHHPSIYARHHSVLPATLRTPFIFIMSLSLSNVQPTLRRRLYCPCSDSRRAHQQQ